MFDFRFGCVIGGVMGEPLCIGIGYRSPLGETAGARKAANLDVPDCLWNVPLWLLLCLSLLSTAALFT